MEKKYGKSKFIKYQEKIKRDASSKFQKTTVVCKISYSNKISLF